MFLARPSKWPLIDVLLFVSLLFSLLSLNLVFLPYYLVMNARAKVRPSLVYGIVVNRWRNVFFDMWIGYVDWIGIF